MFGETLAGPRRKLLVVDDEKDVLYSFKRALGDDEFDLIFARSAEEGIKTYRETRPDLVLMDVRMTEMDGIQALKELRKFDPKALVIIMTAYSSTQTAIEATKAGAYDYVLKPFDIRRIRETLREAIRSADNMKSVVSYQPLLSREEHAEGIIGKSEPMQEVYKEIGRVAAKNVPVLITGETGAGKELVARAIYHHSDRSDKRFVAINCAAIPEELLESELFGHERGAFTGAVSRKIGKFEICDGGTLFLDEIGEISASTQSKLLRVLQEKEFERVGSSTTIRVNVRLIAATNRDLKRMIQERTFREDLYYRLNVVTIHMPTLRERKEDIPLLAEYFVERFGPELGARPTISEGAMAKLEAYDWPGNVRQLENVVKSALLRAKGQVLLPEDVQIDEEPDARRAVDPPPSARAIPAPSAASPRPAGGSDLDLDALMKPVFEEIRRRREGGDKEDAFDLAERCLVRDSLVHERGNQARAAKLLGITRSTLRKRMAKYGIQLRTNIEAEPADD